MTTVPPRVIELVETFDRNIDAYRSSQYNETQLRREFIDPFFEQLGWDVANKAGHAHAYKDVIHEDAISVGSATKAPDYCFRIGGTRKFFLEAKKPSINIRDDPDPAYQLRRYAWSAGLPLSILTDFEEFAVYDCLSRPKQTDRATTARIMYLTYNQYLDNWSKIADIFAREAVLKGSFDKFAASTKGKRGTTTVDVAFLAEIEKWRDMLAKIIALRNRNLSQPEINFAVQCTIDRILFLRMCEGRGIERYGQLQSISSGDRTYPRLCEIFERADQKYNSGLFHFHDEPGRTTPPDTLTPSITIDDKDLKWILYNLYYPQCPYEFSVLPPEILGNVYEQFLGKVITLTSAHHAKIEDKPEVKKAGGVYYTPSYIVDYIVKNTVGNLLDDPAAPQPGLAPTPVVGVSPKPNEKPLTPARHCEEAEGRRGNLQPLTTVRHCEEAEGRRGNLKPLTPKQIENIKILDPACGSGSFLLGAYTCLLNYHRDWYIAHDPEKWMRKKNPPIYQVSPPPSFSRRRHGDVPSDAISNYRLTIAEKKRILLNNIFGVDIDSQAVEVTKLSLLLKVLEGENSQTLENQHRLFHERALPDLAANIKCGNSLIAPDFFDNLDHLAPTPAVGGSPEPNQRPLTTTAAKRPQKRLTPPPACPIGMGGAHDQSTSTNDLYQKINPFDWKQEFPQIFSRKNPGFDAVIGNPPWIFTKYVDWGDETKKYIQTAYLAAREKDGRSRARQAGKINLFAIFLLKGLSLLNPTGCLGMILPNGILRTTVYDVVRKQMLESFTLRRIVDLKSGVFARVTASTAILLLDGERPAENHVIQVIDNRTPGLIQEHVSNTLLQTACLNNPSYVFDIFSDSPVKPLIDKMAIASLKLGTLVDVRNGIATYANMQGVLPKAEDANSKPILFGKDIARYHFTYSGRYIRYVSHKLLRARNEAIFLSPEKLIMQRIGGILVTAYDDQQYYTFNSVNNILSKKGSQYSLKYIMGIINCRLMRLYYVTKFTNRSSLTVNICKTFLDHLPIRTIHFDNPDDKAMHDNMVNLVERMLDLHKKLPAAKVPDEKTKIQRQINTTDRQIDQLVYKLYNLTDEEIKIIEQSTDQNAHK